MESVIFIGGRRYFPFFSFWGRRREIRNILLYTGRKNNNLEMKKKKEHVLIDSAIDFIRSILKWIFGFHIQHFPHKHARRSIYSLVWRKECVDGECFFLLNIRTHSYLIDLERKQIKNASKYYQVINGEVRIVL